MKKMLAILALIASLSPVPAGAHHLGSVYADCKSTVNGSATGAADAGEITVHGSGGFSIIAEELPGVSGLTPAPRYDTNYSGERILFEGDVVATEVSLDFPGYLGGGTATVRAPGGAGTTTTYSGAMQLGAGTFTGHYKVAKKQSYCESLRSRTILHNLYYEVTLSGFLTPTTGGSPDKAWGQATEIAVHSGDVSNH